MKLHHTLALAAALAFAGAANATPYDLGALGPTYTAITTAGGAGAVDDTFTFSLSADSNVTVSAQDLEADGLWTLTDDSVTLYSGVVGSGTAVESAFSFNNTLTTTDYTNLLAGNYYLEVKGTAPGVYAYGIAALANSGTGPSSVPEPADAALLVAGLGMLAFIGGRRRQR